MDIKPKVSVVVPIYNVEKYLRECLESIVNQTLEEIEIILVDDGSKDKSSLIVDEYANSDRRIVAIHQKNSGYTDAVNRGISLASGEYVGIIESDDWIEPDMFERLYNSAKKYNTDITKGCFYKYNSTLDSLSRDIFFRNTAEVDLFNAPDGAFTLEEWPQILAFHSSIWSSIYRADFIKNNKIPESPGASYQDFPFMVQAMTHAKRLSVVKKAFVHWRNEPNQSNSTSSKDGKKLLNMAINTLKAENILKESGKYELLKEPFYAHAIWINLVFFEKTSHKYRKEYFNILRKIYMPLKTDSTFTYSYFKRNERVFIKEITTGGGYLVFSIRYFFFRVMRKFRKRIGKIYNKITQPYQNQLDKLRQRIYDLEEKLSSKHAYIKNNLTQR